MSSSGEEEETGPSVDSVDPEERIAARRIRIERRKELQRKAQMGEDPNEKKEVKEELSKSRKQMEESRLRLTKLISDGTELVTNIRVAGDAREAGRCIEEEETRRQRKDRLEAEAKAGSERFEEITRKWESALQKEIPQDLHEMLTQQKQACDAMIDEKNKLITDFQTELKSKDDLYVKDLKKQAEDIDLMIERMDEQVKQLTKAYRDELEQIEKAFVAERTELIEVQRKKWENTMTSRADKEVEYMKQREKRVEDYEQQLQHLRVQDAEEYNMVKIKLETDVQILQQQLQQMKATYQLNQEKLEYNYTVLKKREDENKKTKSQQKQKIIRLQDYLTNIKIKLSKQEKSYRDENTQLTEDYKRITEQFKELQKKSKHFMETDSRKFHEVWIMNEEEAKTLMRKILEQDRIIHEHQLGIQWKTPDIEFSENVGPISSEVSKPKAVPASQVVQEVMSQSVGVGPSGGMSDRPTSIVTDRSQREDKDGDGSIKDGSVHSAFLKKFSPKLVKTILELLCDESGFLIESKLNRLLSPLERDEQMLMKLDAIFTALGVDTEDDVNLLSQYFLVQREGKSALSARESSVPPIDQELTDRAEDGEDKLYDDEAEDSPRTPRSEKSSAQDLIHPNDVLKALRAFVEDNKQPIKEKGKGGQFKIASLEDRDNSMDTEYWRKYCEMLPQGSEKLWDALLDGLEQYSETLSSRSTLITETDSLRQQNAELRMLLHQYVNSKVNQELEIPPTRVLQLELNPPQ